MSLFGAMSTAISGLNAQSAALGNIGDNVANSQTIGFKRIDTSFADYLTTSTASTNESGSVVARPEYVNNVQGTVVQTDNPLGLAIAGQGFFAVSKQIGEANGVPVFMQEQQFTRAGDFKLNKDGYVVNGFGQFLNGWKADSSQQIDRSSMGPIQVNQGAYNPVPSKEVSLSANLAAAPSGTDPITSTIQVYDAVGTAQPINLTWTPPAATGGAWTLSLDAPNATTPALGSATVGFGASGAPAGTVSSIAPTAASTGLTGSSYAAGQPATLNFTADFGRGAQAITVKMGNYGQGDGLTNYANTKTDYSLKSLTQDGVPPGAFSGVTTRANGDLVVNYTNGQSRVMGRVPVVTFASPNALQRQDGQSFTATREAGLPQAQDPGDNGAGSFVTGSIESSNVDIGKEFTKLIVAQRAYSANTRIVTSSDEMLQQTLDMKR